MSTDASASSILAGTNNRGTVAHGGRAPDEYLFLDVFGDVA